MRHVGDMNSYFERLVAIVNNVQRVIKISRRFGINRKDSILSEISSHIGRSFVCGEGQFFSKFRLRQRMVTNSRSGILQGTAGRHLTTFSLKSTHKSTVSQEERIETEEKGSNTPSFENPQSFKIAFVSLSTSPISPSSSTSVPKGCRLVIGHRLIHATKSRFA